MDERKKYLFIVVGVGVIIIVSIITIFAVLVKSVEKADREMNYKPQINITILDGIYGNPYK